MKNQVPIYYKSYKLDLMLKSREDRNLALQQGPEIPLLTQRQVEKIVYLKRQTKNYTFSKIKEAYTLIDTGIPVAKPLS